MFRFLSPSTQSNPDKVTLLANKFKEWEIEKEEIPGNGNPFEIWISVVLHTSTTGMGSVVSSSRFLSSTSQEYLGTNGGEDWDVSGPKNYSFLPPSLAPE